MPFGAINALSPTMSSLVSSSIQLLFQGSSIPSRDRVFLPDLSQNMCRCGHKGCERMLSGADARSRNALVTLREGFHTPVFPLVSTVRDEYSAMPRFHCSSVCFFLIEQTWLLPQT